MKQAYLTYEDTFEQFEYDHFREELEYLVGKVFGRQPWIAMHSESFGWRKAECGAVINNHPMNIMDKFQFAGRIEFTPKRDSENGYHIEAVVHHHDSDFGDTFKITRTKYAPSFLV